MSHTVDFESSVGALSYVLIMIIFWYWNMTGLIGQLASSKIHALAQYMS